ncbi:4-hydroxy-3-methylbut-2-en-1-yl diphosphate synthase IspG [Gottschalkia acidurici 9a]|uniref:4-hydroxy-3-methylbut-2-en-1-yl diphosphate synthase (flavodoxin) n=1 Tax=Gottschalkia acidurici (strain ATCC 7906 / DSM 604 / BCRC 14475 / CIP 104303 / KCTC 5404 / NCIMB 10678 / 9a) TaxID=1128398 RepID=K0B1K5_GOTA9|nr:4-hydroxy-3-methylbut-2-en-1-yl diphosphate synthase IspG [Gottschalkia acidurici 9a]
MRSLRKITKEIICGNVRIGRGAPITVQSMTNTDTRDIKSTVNQIRDLENVGCDLVRLAVLDVEAAKAISEIKKQTHIPLIADIHFDYRLALESVKNGIDGLRINPGNIGDRERVQEVVKSCKEKNIPIRIGVNSGSISKEVLQRFGGVNCESMIYSAMEHIKILEDLDYTNIKVSLKTTDVDLTVKSYRKISEEIDYPLHIGITEAGTIWGGTIKSSIGIGALLLMGIGDTLRVSLTGDPIEEVKVGKQILRTLGLLKDRVEIISCPTCGRTQIDLIELANKIEKALENIPKSIKVAIMGCAVNGPGEAKEADIGIAGGVGCALIFKKGKL